MERYLPNFRCVHPDPAMSLSLTVEFIINLMAHSATTQEIMAEYPGLTIEDIHACILFASKSLENTVFMPLTMDAA